MAWNGLNASSIIIPDQKLLLQVTPPATETPVPLPVTPTPPPTATLAPSPTVDGVIAQALTPTPTLGSPAAATPFAPERVAILVIILAVLVAGGLIGAGYYLNRKY